LVFQFAISDLFAQGKEPYFFSYAGLSGYYSHYSSNKNHLEKTPPLMGYGVSFREELRFSNSAAILIGAEFFSHGVKFNSYYFADGYSALYDKKFDYKYKVRMNELNFPLLFRANYTGRQRGFKVPYFDFGAVVRWLFSSNMQVFSKDGRALHDGKTSPYFEFPVIWKPVNLFMQVNAGVQFYNDKNWSGLFFELNFRYAPVRFFVAEKFTANNLYFQHFHLGITAGARF
jgi:hypothetical protein